MSDLTQLIAVLPKAVSEASAEAARRAGETEKRLAKMKAGRQAFGPRRQALCDAILALLESGEASTQAVADATGVTYETARSALFQMLEAGQVTHTHGHRRRWRIRQK